MPRKKKKLIVVGDRVLIKPDEGEDRTEVGLYLPKWAVERETVQGGRVVALGPGYPLPGPDEIDDEPWRNQQQQPKFIPTQAKEGDYALFLRKAAVEIRYEEISYLVVPQAAILVLLREEYDLDDLDEPDDAADDIF